MTEYKSFFIKAVIFAVLLILCDMFLGLVFRTLEKKALEKSPFGMATEYTMSKVDADVVIIGSSDAHHAYIPQIIRDSIDLEVYNCGQDGCLFYYKNAAIHAILDRYTPKIIIWDISPNELSTIEGHIDNSLSKLKPFYHTNAFVRDNIDVLSKYEHIKVLSQSYVFNSRLLPYVYKIVMPDYNYQYGAYAPLFGSQNGLEMTEREWEGTFDKRKNDIFINTINRCLKNNVKVVFSFAPRFEKERHDCLESYEQIKKISIEYKNLFKNG